MFCFKVIEVSLRDIYYKLFLFHHSCIDLTIMLFSVGEVMKLTFRYEISERKLLITPPPSPPIRTSWWSFSSKFRLCKYSCRSNSLKEEQKRVENWSKKEVNWKKGEENTTKKQCAARKFAIECFMIFWDHPRWKSSQFSLILSGW